MITTKLVCETGGERLDVFLAANLPGHSRSATQKLLENGSVSLCGANAADVVVVRKNLRTSQGDIYTVTQDEPEVSVVITQDIPLDIVFEDADVVVVNKPRGMVVHPAPGHPDGTLVNALLHHCGDSLSGIGGVVRPGIVHRIDKDTSGLVIAAKNDHAHLSLAAQLSSRTLTREYDAIVCGKVKNDKGRIDAPIGRHPTDRKRQAVHHLQTPALPSALPGKISYPIKSARLVKNARQIKSARHAVTNYEVVARFNGYTYLRCRLETGRTHQIRVHLAYIGYPVLGDAVYGRKKPELGMSSQCLHARKLCFTHPSTNERIELSIDLPDYFKDVLLKLEKREGSGITYAK